MARTDADELLRQLEAAIILKTSKTWEFTSEGQRFVLSLRPIAEETN